MHIVPQAAQILNFVTRNTGKDQEMLYNQRHDALTKCHLHNELLYRQPENGIVFPGLRVVPLQEAFDCIEKTHADLGHAGYKKNLT